MQFKDLIRRSALRLDSTTPAIERPLSWDIFQQGGEWMRARFVERAPEKKGNDVRPVDFNVYGWLKYLTCLAALCGSAYGFYRISPWLLPLSLIVFYVVEIHLLFLFPLLIDGVKYPLRTSIRITYRIGLFRVLARVILIGMFMVLGLFRFSDPFRNWHTGCLAVLIWYEQDVRDRI